jgi:hypothetical protein
MYGIFPIRKTVNYNNSLNSKDWVFTLKIDSHYFGIPKEFKDYIECHDGVFYLHTFSEIYGNKIFMTDNFKSACCDLVNSTVRRYFNYDRKNTEYHSR